MSTIKVTNVSTSHIFFTLVYSLNGQEISISTPAFSPGNIGQLQLPDNAVHTLLTVSILTFSGDYKTIYNDAITFSEDTCYRVNGSPESAVCRKVPCGNLFNSCNPCCCCCYNYHKHC